MPESVTRATGIDALSHALETYVTRPRNAISQLFSRQAWKLLARGLPQVLANPTAMEARSAVLLGAHLAGAAIENSMLGATHALANPLSARFGTTHGVAIGIMLPHVIRYNADTVAPLYGRLAADIDLSEPDDPESAERLADFVQDLIGGTGSPTDLRSLNVDEGLIPTLAAEAAEQWTANFNPRPVDVNSLQELYQCAYSNNGRA
jgi:alcohol dehydrogenase